MKAARIEVGLRAVPYLADHVVQDAVLLPGAFYVAAALRLHGEWFPRGGGSVRSIVFHSPVVLSVEDAQLEVEAKPRDDGAVEYLFREAGGGRVATLEVDSPGSPKTMIAAFDVDEFRARAETTIDMQAYYAALRANGNQYGARFQAISGLWQAGAESLGFVDVPQADDEARQTLVYDGLTQMLASLVLGEGRTFVLRSIASIEGRVPLYGCGLWAYARLSAASGGDYVGEVEAFDASGLPVLKLSGVAFTLVERASSATSDLVVAANFTAEPLEDSLRFWGGHFDLRLRTTFAPYNQVFQQLLDPRSALSSNRDGVNVILLALEEWAENRREPEPLTVGEDSVLLPNGLRIAQLNTHETAYLYDEIFVEECYLRHGIVLEDGDTVVDVGANIGLFSLFVQERCPGARIYAFEPAPPAFDALRANCAAHAPGAKVFNAGVSDKPGTATLTMYGKASVFSGFHAEETADRAALEAVVRNMLKRASGSGEALEDYAGELTADRLARREVQCAVTSISDFMREHQVERINLLKIDAEKSEAAILAGIREDDWAKIDQLVVEVHDPAGNAAERLARQLSERGYRCAVEQPALLRQAGLCNVYATRRAARAVRARDPARDNLERNLEEFTAALRSHVGRTAAPLVLCICPRSSADAAVDDAEHALLREASAIANVHAMSSASLQRYAVSEFHDAAANRAGHVPYTSEGYAALGTAVMRAIHALKRRPRKVIALDCDNTLWKGVCGEDGPMGIELTPAHRAFQELLAARMQAGMLLCLCSKNNERDVLEVFERRADMPLKLSHFAARRTNWQGKAQNLQAIAEELGLGLDSFVFVDDDAVECAQIRRQCPAVLTLQLPREPAALAAFAEHVWAFDRSAVTEEDRSRTRMVRENAQRRQFRERAPSLKEFIDGLELRIDIAAAAEAELGRIAQLVARTNQFSVVSRRRSEAELRQFLQREGAGCIAVRVADRFGDYGLVGAALYELAPDCLRIDSWLLSCRALGRGVEHAMAAWLGRQALSLGRRDVEFPHRPTERNRPALEFFAGIGGPRPEEPEARWRLPSERLARVAYAPMEVLEAHVPISEPRAVGAWDFSVESERWQAVAQDLCSIGKITAAIAAQQRGTVTHASASRPAIAGSLEAALADIWARVLGKGQVGLHDNFFDAGGSSLKAVRVVALMKKELGLALQVVGLLEYPTVASLAAHLAAPSGPPPAETEIAPIEAVRRGQRRRQQQTGLRTT